MSSILSIIIPLYNPHPGWEEELDNSINELKSYFKDKSFTLIIVNDGSTNDLQSDINKLLISHPFILYHSCIQNKGKGHAIREGIKLAHSAYYIYTDWDFPFGQRAVFETFCILESKRSELVIGKRDRTYFESLPLFRKIISRTLRVTNYMTTGFKVVDTQAGLKGLNKRVTSILLSTKIDGFIFELEFIRACLKENVAFAFIDISVDKNAKFSNFKWSIIFRELKTYFKIFLERK